MPRAAYSDRNVISVQLGEKQVVFDFTSKVLDFSIFTADRETGQAVQLMDWFAKNDLSCDYK
ncbi:hypothetical protein D918_07517 [Trichuris suis]|nr:hypothetical protein D918_07517 [Trichuris suis]